MAESNANRRHSDLPGLEVVSRISSLPIVESGIQIASDVYGRIKRSNSLMNWSLDTAEQSIASAKASAQPALYIVRGPITTIDQLLCKGFDIVEQRVPAVTLPPPLIYLNTREFMQKTFVKPVLMRAGSVKQLGSDAANAAADRLDGALTVADKYVDRYLPADPADQLADDSNPKSDGGSKTVRTINHGARFSRKLQRRLTRRTLAEARALKEQGTECIHVLIYVAELIATDPKLALQKAQELWSTLSLPEPENQARPATLEQLLVLLTRESARRVVHFVNGAMSFVSRAPRRLVRILVRTYHQLLDFAVATLKMAPIADTGKNAESQASTIHNAILKLGSITDDLLEQFAGFLAGRPTANKTISTTNRRLNCNNHAVSASNIITNGAE